MTNEARAQTFLNLSRFTKHQPSAADWLAGRGPRRPMASVFPWPPVTPVTRATRDPQKPLNPVAYFAPVTLKGPRQLAIMLCLLDPPHSMSRATLTWHMNTERKMQQIKAFRQGLS